MMTMMHLQQTLKSLCLKTGWCYAVFWKLKRRSRMMLTWEDGYCDYSKSSADSCNNHGSIETGGNPLDQGGSGDLEGKIGIAVARMSYYVYSMGEGIIGRVAFTGKHEWIFHDEENHMEAAPGGILNNQHPDGWQNQFVAGIKTIAVIAVPQGVVQLGSTKLITEDLKWIDHIKSVFGALQTAPSLQSDYFSEGQGGRLAYSVPFMSAASTSTTLRPITVQESQCSLRNVEDALHWHKHGLQASPKGPSNLQGLQSMDGTAFVAGAMLQELQHQQVVKRLEEAQRSKYASTHRGPQSSQICAMDPHLDLPLNRNQKILSRDEMRSCHLKDSEEKKLRENEVERCKESLLMGLVTGGVSTGLHNEFEGNVGLLSCLPGQIDEDFSSNQEDICLSRRYPMYSMFGTKKDERISGMSSSYKAGHQQQVDTETPLQMPACDVGSVCMLKQDFPSFNLSPSSRSFLKRDVADQHCNSSSVKDKIANQKCSIDVSQTALASCRLPAKHSTSNFHASDGSASTIKDSVCLIACLNALDKELLGRSESMVSEENPNVCSFGSQSDASILNELQHFLESFSRDCSFAIGDELSQALGPTFRKGVIDNTFEELPHLSGDQKIEAIGENLLGKAYERQDDIVHQRLGSCFVNDNFNKTMLGIHFPESKSEPLLDAVVGNASNSHRSVSSNADGRFSDKTIFSNQTSGMDVWNMNKDTESKTEAFSLSLSGKRMQAALHREAVSDVHTTCVVKNAQGHQNFCVSKDSPAKVVRHSWADEGQSLKSDSQSKKSEEFPKAGKKRSRSGESTRPRPKDRQQIQDRVRELRDIVPNGSKCSIDALLEKTIKHMLFLQSVTLHADQLKKNGDLKDDLESGASWALDLGGQECPIIVKDLNQPHQMLVEIMFEERGLFLEIVDSIRSLGLTILKGVMESQNDKIWAKFFVEADRHVQRVDVLASLIQLHLDNNSSSSAMTVASQSAPIRSQ